ncbi:helix-turn-helix transcriptional regulator [Agromyces protaetiae]|uniref:Helix-turn-helix transcriptional regulator n=2 Tax=Agromyces protaetiae TaxID=2509455 RepID=A0A4P6FA87_9MICO|nr:helix-turn-helix transcriptional regulator [Agromyces protaetiae]
MGRTASYLRNAGESERALALIKAAIAEAPDGSVHVPRLLRDQAIVLGSLGKPGTVELLRDALARIAAFDQTVPEVRDLHAAIMTALAGRLMIAGEIDAAVEIGDESYDLAVEIGALRSASVARNIASISRISRGEVAEGLEGLEEAHDLAGTDGTALLRYWVNVSDTRSLIGDHEQAVRLAEAGLEIAREQGVERSSGVLLAANAAEPLIALGEWDRAQALVERGLSLDPPPPFKAYLQRARLVAALWSGDVEAAVAGLRAVYPMMAKVADVEVQTRFGLGRLAAEILLEGGDLAGAWREASIALDGPAAQHVGYVALHLWPAARVLGEAGRDPARAAAAGLDVSALAGFEGDVLSRLDEIAVWPTHTLWSAFVRAELAHGPREAVEAWRTAVAAAEASQAFVYLAPYARFRLAEALLEAGDRQAARMELQAAADLADERGVGLVRRHVDRLAQAAGLALATRESGDDEASAEPSTNDVAPEASDLDDLTARERQVLDLIAEGLSNKQIGERLFISGKTASVHVSAILRKLGASSRTEAAVRARGVTVAE